MFQIELIYLSSVPIKMDDANNTVDQLGNINNVNTPKSKPTTSDPVQPKRQCEKLGGKECTYYRKVNISKKESKQEQFDVLPSKNQAMCKLNHC